MKDDAVGPSISQATLSRMLKDIGYSYKTVEKRVHLLEKQHLKEWRMKYIQRRNQNELSDTPKLVIYLDESWIDCNATAKKGWIPKIMKDRRDRLQNSINAKPGKGPRLIMLHAGSKNGFVQGAMLLKDSKTTDEDYHKEMDGFGFLNWFKKSLLPNIPQNCIIVMDNAPYHSMTTTPKSNWRVQEMRDWLISKNISFPGGFTKKEIWEIIKLQKINYDHYVVDRLARDAGHEILRLPPYHCDLNPIEMVWGHTKAYVAKYNNSGLVSDVKNLAETYMTAYPAEAWQNSIRHVNIIAQEYQRSDGFSAVPPIHGQLLIPLGEDSTDTEDFDSEDESSDYDLSDNDGAESYLADCRNTNMHPKALF